jgi:hypothetical protein
VAEADSANAWVAFFQGQLRRRYGEVLAQALPRGGAPDARARRHLELLGRDFYGVLGVVEGLLRNPGGYSVGEVARFLDKARELMPADVSKDELARFFHLRAAVRANLGDEAGAVQDFETAFSTWPVSDNPAIVHLEELYTKAGNQAALDALRARLKRARVAIVAVRAAGVLLVLRDLRDVDGPCRQGPELGPSQLSLLPAVRALGGRLAQDFFAASAQSYLNPVGYPPFYLMAASGWHSVLTSVVLACCTRSACRCCSSSRTGCSLTGARERLVFSCLATALGAATWVFWPTVGTSFLDPLLVPLMLAGLLCFSTPERAGRRAARRRALRHGGGA